MDKNELIRRLRFLVSLNNPDRGGPYGGTAAAQCMEAMTQAADMLEQQANVFDLLAQHGIDKSRLDEAMKSKDNWGGMVHAYEYVTTCSAVLASWPKENHG